MDKIEDSEKNANISDSAYNNHCNNNQKKRSYSSKSIHSESNSNGSSGYGGKKSNPGYSYNAIIMNKTEDTENNAKVSDSAYSNSCSNSQSRRSYSSKSMHSGSNSSGSSGYGGKLSAYGHSHDVNQPPEKRTKDKEGKKKMKKSVESQVTKENNLMESPAEPAPVFEKPEQKINNVDQTPPPALVIEEQVPENMEISTSDRGSTKEECGTCTSPIATSMNYVNTRPISEDSSDGFSCVISMQDGVLMYTTSSITTALGFPKDMWLGRSFIDFVHPRDRNAFASQITSGLAVPKNANVPALENHKSTMVCRIRRYRGLTSGFRIKDKMVTYMPFLLNFLFKNINDEDGPVVYLVIRATPLFSAFKTANEIILNPKPFVVRHSACGSLEYIDPESVPYLGYIPQDIIEKDFLQLYHPDDLEYLRQVYETIVKEGAVQRSKPYRMLTQNGDYLKLESEWSSFINPWSRKLEFVLGKHFIVEGPKNPDVFQASDSEKTPKIPDEEQANAQNLRENIIKIMNEVLTKPAEAAKQQMGKRCQDLATFMESLMEETPKINEELRIDIQDTNHSLYERDSVVFGGMSPHHEFNESKSSTDTTVSYTQLNYNETLQRYFDSHEPYEEYRPILNKLELRESVEASSICVSPMAQDSEDYGEKSSMCNANDVAIKKFNQMGDYQGVRLTESLLNKHNAEMEKELVKMHRENRSGIKNEKEKVSFETRQKKKEHLARCNALFHPTIESHADTQPHGVKRASKQVEEATSHKHRCSSSRVTQQKQIATTASMQQTSTTTTAVVSSPWPTSSVNSMNTFILGLGIPQQMSLVNSISMPGIIPMYYTPASLQPTTATQANNINPNTFQIQGYPNPNGTYPEMSVPHYQEHTGESDGIAKNNPECTTTSSSMQYQPQQIPCVMFGQAVYGSPFMYSSIDPQVSYTLQQSFVPQNITNVQALDNTNKNSEEACRLSLIPKAGKSFSYLTRKREKTGGNKKEACDVSNSSADVLMRSTEVTVENRNKRQAPLGNSDGTNDKTDEESSYSSFYSTFFKTDSGSNEESETKNIVNKNDVKYWQNHTQSADRMSFQSSDAANVNSNNAHNKVSRRKIDPPWMEQVRVTSELVYKYQILSENVDDVLTCDKEKLQKYEQPSLVNEQLEQLYLDLQLEGVAARLTLEEGITSSSSSGEESFVISKSKSRRRKREYSKLVMIYEEDAPLPPPDKDDSSL